MKNQKESTRIYKLCDYCFLLEPDLVIAMSEMTDASLAFIKQTAENILLERKKETNR